MRCRRRLAWTCTGDTIRVDPGASRCDARVGEAEIARRQTEAPPPMLESRTPWAEIHRAGIGSLATGDVLEAAAEYHRIADRLPRHNH